jgi:hypothetical protein
VVPNIMSHTGTHNEFNFVLAVRLGMLPESTLLLVSLHQQKGYVRWWDGVGDKPRPVRGVAAQKWGIHDTYNVINAVLADRLGILPES